MPNFYPFNRSDRPVFDQVTNTLSSPVITAGTPYSASVAGNVYSAFTTTSASLGLLGGTVQSSIRLNNPSSTRTCYIIRVAGGVGVGLSLLSSLTASYSLYQNGTLTSPTPLTPINANLGSTNTSSMSVTSSTGAVSGGTLLLTVPVNAGAIIADYNGSIIVPPSTTLSLSISAALTVAGTLSTQASFLWWEVG
ncbi:hypothetical protein [Paenibacillus agilis]|uniref:Uncharacterized protein n=1 Tax=Paenibacillus agilis TaxID=3020863 RepID=A0A559IPM2_9BACL|nr:hypothetical protein [Paenibacillus agilis]TVX89594.1 hypothetical protein FPZ44_17615 [Paenibacillus agilis]